MHILSHAKRVCQAFYTKKVYYFFIGENKMLKFKENLLNELYQNDMTQQDLASAVGTTQQTISRWIKGINEPDLDTLLEICFVLNTTPNEILGFNELTRDDYYAYCQTKEALEKHKIRHLEAFHDDYKKNNH